MGGLGRRFRSRATGAERRGTGGKDGLFQELASTSDHASSNGPFSSLRPGANWPTSSRIEPLNRCAANAGQPTLAAQRPKGTRLRRRAGETPALRWRFASSYVANSHSLVEGLHLDSQRDKLLAHVTFVAGLDNGLHERRV